MRRTTISLIAVLMCAWVSSFGQSNGQPQWKVVKQGHVVGGMNSISPTLLFTPSKDGLYRVSLYAAGIGLDNGYYDIYVSWTDRANNFAEADLNIQSSSPSQDVIRVFAPKVETQVMFAVTASGTQGATYDVAFTIEKLTH